MPAQNAIRMRDDLVDLEPYDPGACVQEVILSANENPFGVPRALREAMNEAVAQSAFNRYPDPLADALREDIASWHDVSRDCVIVGNGGDEIIFDLLLAFGGSQRTLIDCPPTFSIYALYAKLTGTNVVTIVRDEADFSIDRESVEKAAAQADLIMLTSPNNPTGNLVDPAWVQRLAASTDALVVVDEAYVEFAKEGSTCLPLVSSCGNVAVLRTFSKAFALAGARCGYLIGPADVVRGIAAVRQPYSVNVLSQAVARVAVQGRAAYQLDIEEIRRERARLIDRLSEIDGIEVWPSEGNFVLVRMPNASEVYERLRDRFSILVRNFSRSAGLKDCLRITVGTPGENQRVVSALDILRKEMK